MSQKEIEILIGGRSFEVACQDGEEQFLLAAAQLLNGEAQVLVEQIGRMPEARMLLMSGLMLADKTAGLEERLREAEDVVGGLRAELAELRNQPAPEPERIEVPRIPPDVTDAMAELAARAETIAETVDEKLKSAQE